MRVFSPTKANRERYAQEMTEQLDIEVVPVDSPEKALKGADIVSLTTDSLVPVIKAEWLEPGMHINNVRNNEAGEDVLKRAEVRARLGTSTLFAERNVAGVTTGSDGMFAYIAGNAEEKKQIPVAPHHDIDNPNIGTVPDIMAGHWIGRANDQQVTFLNNQGTQGLQFAAVGGTAYNLAKALKCADRPTVTRDRLFLMSYSLTVRYAKLDPCPFFASRSPRWTSPWVTLRATRRLSGTAPRRPRCRVRTSSRSPSWR